MRDCENPSWGTARPSLPFISRFADCPVIHRKIPGRLPVGTKDLFYMKSPVIQVVLMDLFHGGCPIGVYGAKFGIRERRARSDSVSARFYRHAVKSS